MSDPKTAAPLLDGFTLGAPMSSHDGVRCYPALKENSDDKYIIKLISIPASAVQLDALLLTGAYKDPADAMDYFKEVSEDVVREAEILNKLSKLDGFLPYESWKILPQEEGQLGYQVCLAGTYKRSLEKHMRRTIMTHLEAVNLGLDLCQALSICRRAGYLYIDLKPGNVFISREKEYRIGDLGFADLSTLQYTSLPAKYVSPYSAPETRDPMKTLNDTVDTYAAGMILYQIYNDGVLPTTPPEPTDPFPTPVNADYEIAEIILKAVAPDPKERWKDPMEMGQALVAYMQRNTINNTPIAPSTELNTEGVALDQTISFAPIRQPEAVTEEATAEAAAPVEEAPAEAPPEEAAPAAEAAPIPETTADDDAEQDPAPEAESPAEQDPPTEQEPSAAPPSPVPTQQPQLEPVDEEEEALFNLNASSEEEDDDLPEEAEPQETVQKPPVKKERRTRKKRKTNWITPVLTVIVLALLACCGFLFYHGYYLQTIHDLTIEGSQDTLTVHVDTDMDQSLLSVICTDTYGNARTQNLVDGQTVFTDLLPNSQYKIQLKVSGFHELVGKTTDVFNTEAHTNIVSISAIAGAEDGSLMLTITVDGTEPDEWIMSYNTEGEALQSQVFSGHNVTIRGLTVGQVYTFELSTNEDIYLTGNTVVQFSVERNILAKNLHVASFSGSEITVRWSAPEDSSVESWNVRCYDNDGNELVQDVTDTTAVFTGVDPAQGYTIEVLALGMTQPARTTITANPITITALNVEQTDSDALNVTWEYEGSAPEGGWLLLYSVDGSETPDVIKCEEPSAVIEPGFYGATYNFVIQAADSTSIFENIHAYICPTPEVFSTQGLSADKITGYLLKTPAQSDWTYEGIDDEELTDQFTLGDPMSLVLKADSNFYLASEEISILYIFRDGRGNVIPELAKTDTVNWTDIWYAGDYHAGELDIPVSPEEPGEYSLCLYFNGKAVLVIGFTVSE